MEDAGAFPKLLLAIPGADDILHAGVECAFCETWNDFVSTIGSEAIRLDDEDHTDEEAQSVDGLHVLGAAKTKRQDCPCKLLLLVREPWYDTDDIPP